MKKNPAKARETVFYVPNDEEGRQFLALARKFLNREHWQLRPYARNPNRKQYRGKQCPYGKDKMGAPLNSYRLQSSVPLPFASYWGVYVWNETHREEAFAEKSARWTQLMEMEAEINRLKGELVTQQQKLEADALGQMLHAMKESERIECPQRKITLRNYGIK